MLYTSLLFRFEKPILGNKFGIETKRMRAKNITPGIKKIKETITFAFFGAIWNF
jgi:hypothetical protein